MGKVFVKSLELFVRIGTTAEERAEKQRLLVDIEIEPKTPFEALEDNLFHTVDYAQLCSDLVAFTETYTSHLIETLAVELGNLIKHSYSVRSVSITVYKFVLPNTEFVAAQYKSKNAADNEDTKERK